MSKEEKEDAEMKISLQLLESSDVKVGMWHWSDLSRCWFQITALKPFGSGGKYIYMLDGCQTLVAKGHVMVGVESEEASEDTLPDAVREIHERYARDRVHRSKS